MRQICCRVRYIVVCSHVHHAYRIIGCIINQLLQLVNNRVSNGRPLVRSSSINGRHRHCRSLPNRWPPPASLVGWRCGHDTLNTSAHRDKHYLAGDNVCRHQRDRLSIKCASRTNRMWLVFFVCMWRVASMVMMSAIDGHWAIFGAFLHKLYGIIATCFV